MDKQEIWYQEGLKFGCRQCGRCCTGEEGYVWVTDEEIERLAKALNMRPLEFESAFVRLIRKGQKSLVEFPNGDCVLWSPETKGCRAYEVRPVQCRTWPFWTQNVDRPSSWRKTAKFCHGCNNPNGHLFTEEEITARVNEHFGE